MSVSFDTLKFARALREKANMSSEQAEGVAEAFSGATTDQLVTKADLLESEGRLRSETADLRASLRSEIADLRAFTAEGLAKVNGEMALLKWMIGFVLVLLIAVFGKLFLR